MNRESRGQLRTLLLKIGLTDADLPLNEHECTVVVMAAG
jgi:hypothetical protein